MKRRNFLHKTILASTAVAAITPEVLAKPEAKQKNIFELRVYELRWSQDNLVNFFTKALIPFLNNNGVKKVGVFSEVAKSEPAKIYLLIPYASFEDFAKVNQLMKTDSGFIQASDEYNKISQDQAAYIRYESSLMVAFDGLPNLIAPELKPRIFELRTYEGYSEDAVRRKIKMFNDEEFPIFYRTKLNPVFFGEVVAGGNLPCLTYMITFKDMQERDNNWKAFGADPVWQRISKAPEYANTVSKIRKVFLEPLSCSQI